MEKQHQPKEKSIIKRERLLAAILVAVAIPLIVCLAVPLEIYANNMDEFLFSLWDFLPLCLLTGLLVTGLNLAVLLTVPEIAYRIVSMILLALALLLFLQGTYLNGTLTLAGDQLGDTLPSVASTVINLIIWIVLFGGFLTVAMIPQIQGPMKKIALVLACIVVFIQIITPVFNIISNPNIFLSKEDKLKNGSFTNVATCVTNRDITTLSNHHNVLYFLFDRFDEFYAEEMLRQAPELFENLDGFTHFNDNISLYAHTYPSVQYMLTNHRYNLDLSRVENLREAFTDATPLQTMHDAGYRVSLYGESYYDFTPGDLPDYIHNLSEIAEYKVTNPIFLAAQMMGLALYRCFPFATKVWLSYINSNTFNQCLSIKGADGYDQYDSGNQKVLDLVRTTPFATTDQDVFTFIHVFGCHDVYMDYKGGTAQASPKTVATMRKSLEQCFDIVNLYIQALKDHGTYEDATIIITGDHPNTVNYDRDYIVDPQLTALFVKPAGRATGALQTVDTPVAHANIWPTIFAAEKITSTVDGTSVFAVDTDNPVTREYVYQNWNRSSLDQAHFNITGSGRTFANWELTKTETRKKFLMD